MHSFADFIVTERGQIQVMVHAVNVKDVEKPMWRKRLYVIHSYTTTDGDHFQATKINITERVRLFWLSTKVKQTVP